MDKIISLLFIISIILSSIIIGVPLQNEPYSVYCIIAITMILYLIKNYIYNKEKKQLTSWKDWSVIILVISSVLPLILGTKVNANNTIIYILRYISVASIYFLAKDFSKNNPKMKKYITNIVLICSSIMILIGIDLMTTKYTEGICELIIGKIYSDSLEVRMTSFFRYFNPMAVYSAFTLFISISQLIKEQKVIKKAMYATYTTISIIGIILTESRALIIILLMAMIVYFIFMKNKRINLLIHFITNLILAMAYVTIFYKSLEIGNYLITWCAIALTIIIAILFNVTLQKVYIKNMKYKIICLSSLIIIPTIAIGIMINVKDTYTIFNSENAKKEIIKYLGTFEPNKNYVFEFELETKTKENFFITIAEKNKYLDIIKEHKVDLKDYSGIKKVEFTTLPETAEIVIIFNANKTTNESYMKINHLFINGKNKILHYRYLPDSFMYKMSNIDKNNRSVWERFTLMHDALILAKEHPIIGIGGGAWENKFEEARQYKYNSTEIHSYPIQLILENGLLGIGSMIAIWIAILIKFIQSVKEDNKENITIIMALGILTIHSFFDFGMSYYYLLALFFMYFGFIEETTEKARKHKNTEKLIILSIIVLSITAFVTASAMKSRFLEEIAKNCIHEQKIKIENVSVKLRPFDFRLRAKYIQDLAIYKENNYKLDKEQLQVITLEIINQIKKIYIQEHYYNSMDLIDILKINAIDESYLYSKESSIETLEFAKQQLINLEDNFVYEPIAEMNRLNCIKDIGGYLYNLGEQQKAKECYNMIIQLEQITMQKISDIDKCRITKDEEKKLKEELNKLVEFCKNEIVN